MELLKSSWKDRNFRFGLLAFAGVLFITLGMHRAHAATRHAHHKPRAEHALKHASKAKPKAPAIVIVSKEPHDAPDRDWSKDIAKGRELLAKLPKDSDTPGNFSWHLAVKCGESIEIVSFKPSATQVASVSGYAIALKTENGINTRFVVKKPEGCVVVAQKRVVRTPTGHAEAVYTAYAPEMDTKTMRDAGVDYLRFLQRHAFQAIKDRDVRSRTEPGATVADKIPASMVLRLLITEHIDPLHMKYAGLQQCIHEVLFTYAANREHAYAYAKSSAGARGPSQFMEDSYRMVRMDYPAALLEPDFVRGTTTMTNVVLASILHMDLELGDLPKDSLKQIHGSGKKLASFLAAGYNCNSKVIANDYQKTHVVAGGRKIPAETKLYVKLQAGIGVFLHEEYDVPSLG